MVEPGPKYTDSMEHVEKIKTLIVWGDHFEGHQLWSQTRSDYDKMAGDISVYDLPAMGIRGNSHFPMSDRNSDQVSKLVFDWLQHGGEQDKQEKARKKTLAPGEYFQSLFNAGSVSDINSIVYKST